MNRISRFMSACVLIVLFSGCSASTDEAKTKILFDLGYGKSDSSLDLSGGEKNAVDISLKKGIFHLLSRGEAKILRISSYGQTLAMWYDPRKGSAPLVLKDVQINDLSAGKELGRFAMQVPFNDPWPMAADSRQLLYVADNRFIRRFDSDGKELQPLGQEGIGGSMFPMVTALDTLENDDLAVLCASESETSVYFYDKNAVFLHVLKLNDQTMPVPSSILEKNPDTKGSRIIASLESISPSYFHGRMVVVLKINYYMEKYDPDSGVTLSIDPVGGWIIGIDAGNGTILDSFPLQSSVNDLGIDQQLIGAKSNSILSVRWDDKGIGGEVFRYNQKGKVIGKLNFLVPDPEAALVAMIVGDDDYLYLLGQLPSTLRMYAWKLPSMGK
ncbi:exported hypothetical protein [uncultured spirochete]|jgi:hypothetical protein|uniref:Lipoprotein n=1 Tax=uncultured spirochete TaxID=156406 RepID=A0A3P3XUV7_9SPIR|nr:exported hypothetical protein [uncultured spirochete]